MGDILEFRSENLIIGVLSSDRGTENEIRSALESEFGPVDMASDMIEFNCTTNYNNEMGSEINRWFYSFEKLVDPSKLSAIKIRTNEMEEKWAVTGQRKVNLDPGLLDLNRLILATTKNVGHRIPLLDGIYGEVTLMYMNKDFHALPWTYPDYQSDEYRIILKEIRNLYRQKLKHQK